MFHLYQHHDLEALAETLAGLLSRTHAASALTPRTILVPNRGTARWLQAQLAESEGSAANLELALPGHFVWQALRGALADRAAAETPDSSQYQRGHLVWHLYALLPSLEIPEVARYLEGEPRERHRYQLALRLADVFDQYLIHRRSMLAAWEAGRERADPPEAWQAPVWRALVARLGPCHRAALLTALLERAAAGSLDASALPDPIHVFGVNDLPADYLRLLHALGDYVDIHFLLPNPSAGWWGDVRRRRVGAERADDDEAHPLLASFGRAGRDFLQVLYGDEFAGMAEPDLSHILPERPPDDGPLLQRVQSAIVAGTAQAEDRDRDDGDDSIQIHACHGPLREIQTLHDRLLDLLTKNADVEPRDVRVLLPDVGRYAPAVHGVFGAATEGRWIPYAVADRPRVDTHPIARSFRQLLDLPLSRWSASEVLATAGVPAVARRFALGDDDLALLHHWCAEAGVRWGLDGEDRAQAGATAFEQNTWRFGLDRLLLGLAQRAPGELVDGVAPWSDLEGGPATAVGALWSLLQRLRAWRDRLRTPATPGIWQDRLNGLLADLFAADPDDAAEQAALEHLHEAIAAFEGAARAMPDEELSREAMREVVDGALTAAGERQPLLTGGVTFCGLEPLRGVPGAVICLLGLDEDTFPRSDGPREFNAIRQAPQTGDPSARDTDRMIFLQSLMAARRCFYLSYTGRNIQDGAPLEPSPAVGEFLDYLHGWHFAGRDRTAFRGAMVTTQPMQPFSPGCFDPANPACFTFADEWRQAALAQRGERAHPPAFIDEGTAAFDPPDPAEPVDLADLRRFFRHPAEYFFREQLDLDLTEDEDVLQDHEPLALNSLEAHQLRERLFDEARHDDAAAVATAPTQRERARGQLPPPPLGGADYEPAAGDVNALLVLQRRWRAEGFDETPIDIDTTLADGTRLVGRAGAADLATAGEMRRLRPGRLPLRHRLPAWFDYLAAVAAGHALTLRLAGVNDGKPIEAIARVERAAARDYLAAAVERFREGHRRPLLFTPDLAERYLAETDKTDKQTGEPTTPRKALGSLNGWLGNDWSTARPRDDPYLRLLFGPDWLGTDPERSSLVRTVDAVAAPARAAFADVEPDA